MEVQKREAMNQRVKKNQHGYQYDSIYSYIYIHTYIYIDSYIYIYIIYIQNQGCRKLGPSGPTRTCGEKLTKEASRLCEAKCWTTSFAAGLVTNMYMYFICNLQYILMICNDHL